MVIFEALFQIWFQKLVHDHDSSLIIYFGLNLGMKSLVNWPGNDNHKLPEYSGSEKDVFKVICDYFTNASGPLTTFSLYNLLVEAFVRVEACDIHFRKSKEQTDEEDDSYSLSSRGSVQSLVMKMASPAVHCKTSTPLGDYSSTQYLAK